MEAKHSSPPASFLMDLSQVNYREGVPRERPDTERPEDLGITPTSPGLSADRAFRNFLARHRHGECYAPMASLYQVGKLIQKSKKWTRVSSVFPYRTKNETWLSQEQPWKYISEGDHFHSDDEDDDNVDSNGITGKSVTPEELP